MICYLTADFVVRIAYEDVEVLGVSGGSNSLSDKRAFVVDKYISVAAATSPGDGTTYALIGVVNEDLEILGTCFKRDQSPNLCVGIRDKDVKILRARLKRDLLTD